MIHNIHASQYIPPTLFHIVSATAAITHTAGAVAGSIAVNRGAANETTLVTIPIMIPSNARALQGAKLVSVEVDFINGTAEFTSHTFVLNRVTRGADLSVAVVDAITKTDSVAATASHAVDEVKQVVTLTTPEWVDHDTYYLLEDTIIAGAGGGTCKFLGAVANFTLRL